MVINSFTWHCIRTFNRIWTLELCWGFSYHGCFSLLVLSPAIHHWIWFISCNEESCSDPWFQVQIFLEFQSQTQFLLWDSPFLSYYRVSAMLQLCLYHRGLNWEFELSVWCLGWNWEFLLQNWMQGWDLESLFSQTVLWHWPIIPRPVVLDLGC